MATARSRRVVGCLAAATVVAAVAPALTAAASAAKDPNGIACPAAPAGWSLPATGGKKVEDAATDVRLRPSDAVTVNCNYFATRGRYILVNVQYALPSDPNPNSDFDFGCSSSDTQWNTTDRIFRVMSRDEWAYATFFDSTGELAGNEVPQFEGVTRQLLQNAGGYAHACNLRVAPTAGTTRYTFSFVLPAGHAAGSFSAKATTNGVSAMPVVAVTVPTIVLSVVTRGRRDALTVRVTRGIDYHESATAPNGTVSLNATVRFAVQVLDSGVPACPKGANGTLSVSTPAAVFLSVCGRSFLTGRATTSISLLN
jgi:hypothetical protein